VEEVEELLEEGGALDDAAGGVNVWHPAYLDPSEEEEREEDFRLHLRQLLPLRISPHTTAFPACIHSKSPQNPPPPPASHLESHASLCGSSTAFIDRQWLGTNLERKRNREGREGR
jgi:hypothetical protein